jgi:hypothetical protein
MKMRINAMNQLGYLFLFRKSAERFKRFIFIGGSEINMKSPVYSGICALVACLFFNGCLVIPMRYPTKGPIKLDYKSFLPGKTTRGEIANAVTEGDTGVALRHCIWARWDKSNWGYLWGVGAISGSGAGGGTGGSTRMWGAENFLAEFDENDILKNWRIVSDNNIAGELAPLICRDGSKGAREFMILSAFHSHWNGRAPGMMELNNSYIEFKEQKTSGHSFRIEPSAIQALFTQEGSSKQENSRAIKAYLHTKSSGKLEMELVPGALMDLLTYLHEYAPGVIIGK